ncbi:MAG: ABC transporter substrate-binding (seleno)protein SaoB [Filifactoraceae bacterium]
MDMAIVCKDIAQSYVKINKDFEIQGILIKNSDLILKNKADVKKIGISKGRAYQKELVRSLYKEAEIMEVISSGLPYYMYSGKIDAILVDGLKALTLDGNFEYPNIEKDTYVLVINKKIKNTAEYKKFVKDYNEAVQLLSDKNTLIGAIERYKGVKLSQKDKDVIISWNLKLQKVS